MELDKEVLDRWDETIAEAEALHVTQDNFLCHEEEKWLELQAGVDHGEYDMDEALRLYRAWINGALLGRQAVPTEVSVINLGENGKKK